LADSQVFKLGPGIGETTSKPDKPQTRSVTAAKKPKKTRKETKGEDEVDLEDAKQALSMTVDPEFDLVIPSNGPDGLPLTLQEREVICSEHLRQKTSKIMAATNEREIGALKARWTRAWWAKMGLQSSPAEFG
jgi:hypothetical protein